ncbi:MAG: ATPase [Planctomycetes bacterium]|nr:ATPase [Planctomycetota bacterium]
MLTRLRVSGFKNLVDVDVRFGPFTCVAGANGTGKSNLFDAIHFLSLLADKTLLEAALSIRDASDLRNLFHRVGDHCVDQMSFEAEMITPPEGEDDLGQRAKASATFLRYSLVLGSRQGNAHAAPRGLEIIREELAHVKLADAHKHLLFPHRATTWRRSAVMGRRSAPYFISTDGEGSARVITVHRDAGSPGRPARRSAANLPRTTLSVVNAAENATAALARNEMRSWRVFHLEPPSLRRPDSFMAVPRLGPDGSNLAATLYSLAAIEEPGEPGEPRREASRVYARVASRLSELVDDVRVVFVDRDEKRELLTLMATGKDGTTFPAAALSDGTLRFLGIAVLGMAPGATGLICLEEPENGIHPARIPAMIRLLQDIVTDPDEEAGPDNPLRQVIINTHSPAVVGQVDRDGLVVAQLVETVRDGKRFKRADFGAMPGTWRCQNGAEAVSLGRLLAYLNPVLPPDADEGDVLARKRARVIDSPELQRYLPFTQSCPS